MSGFALTPAGHREVTNRLSTWRRAITAASTDRPAIGAEIAKLLAAFAAQNHGVSVSLQVAAYSEALGDAPAWAVAEARHRLITGTADIAGWNQGFAPSPVQFGGLVRSILKPFRDDLADLEVLASVEPDAVPPPDERERVSAGFDALRAEIGGKAKPKWHDSPLDSLARRARENSVDFESTMDAIPDAPARQGTFRRLAP